MKLKLTARAMSLSVLIGLVSCASPPKTSRPEPAWLNNMHRLSAAHLRLMPLVADAKKFSDPSHREEIKQELKAIVATSAAIVNDNKAPNVDPIIAFNSAEFAGEARQAYAAFEINDLQWTRFSFARMSGYCISCHTRADRGVKDFELAWAPELSSLNAMQNVEFLLANRRYGSALAQARRLATEDQLVRQDPHAWILTIERALGMVIRVNKDPEQAKVLAELVLKNKSAPYYMRRDASQWVRDIGDWQNESRSGRTPVSFRAAVRLAERAQKYGLHNSSTLILNLRASGMLHELLENTRASQYGETLLYSGGVANSLRDLNMGFLDQYYYESCINYKPHSELAERCYAQLESSVRDSNPLAVVQPEFDMGMTARLADFRKLAEVKDLIDDPRWIHRSWDDDFGEKASRTDSGDKHGK